MDQGWRQNEAFSGGCQCGHVRYDVTAGPVRASVCHCRMCQRATGAPLAGFLEVGESRVTWHGTPGVFASSNLAERCFCPQCGTSLFYRGIGSGTIELTSGSLPATMPFTPSGQCGVEARHPWLGGLDRLPAYPASRTGIESHQFDPEAPSQRP